MSVRASACYPDRSCHLVATPPLPLPLTTWTVVTTPNRDLANNLLVDSHEWLFATGHYFRPSAYLPLNNPAGGFDLLVMLFGSLGGESINTAWGVAGNWFQWIFVLYNRFCIYYFQLVLFIFIWFLCFFRVYIKQYSCTHVNSLVEEQLIKPEKTHSCSLASPLRFTNSINMWCDTYLMWRDEENLKQKRVFYSISAPTQLLNCDVITISWSKRWDKYFL